MPKHHKRAAATDVIEIDRGIKISTKHQLSGRAADLNRLGVRTATLNQHRLNSGAKGVFVNARMFAVACDTMNFAAFGVLITATDKILKASVCKIGNITKRFDVINNRWLAK